MQIRQTIFSSRVDRPTDITNWSNLVARSILARILAESRNDEMAIGLSPTVTRHVLLDDGQDGVKLGRLMRSHHSNSVDRLKIQHSGFIYWSEPLNHDCNYLPRSPDGFKANAHRRWLAIR